MQIFTDGGCHGNPGPGAWAYIVRSDGNEYRDSAGEKITTNNRMELSAVIEALRFAKESGHFGAGASIEIYTDSQYVQKGISEWIVSWMRNGWKTATKDPVKNKELWQALWDLTQALKPSWRWVKGHAGHPENEACDALVQETIRSIEQDHA